MKNDAAHTMAIFFRVVGFAFLILCIRAPLIVDLSYKVPQTIFYTAMNNYMIAIQLGIPAMFLYWVYNYFELKVKEFIKRFIK